MMRFIAVVVPLLVWCGCVGPEESRRRSSERSADAPAAAPKTPTTRRFQMPLTAAEAALIFPALVSTAQSMGLEASHAENRAYVKLETGDELLWWVKDVKFQLQATLADTSLPAAQVDLKMRDLKVRADQIWDLAIEQRQKNNVGAVVVQQPAAQPPPPPVQQQQWGNPYPQQQPQYQQPYAPPPPQQPTFGAGRRSRGGFNQQPQQMAPPAGSSCRSSLDCGSGDWCKDRGDGVNVCMGHGGQGAPCSSSLDCEGMWCRGDTFKTCQP